MSNFVLAQPAHNRLGAGIAVAVIYVPLWLTNIIHASANNATFKDREICKMKIICKCRIFTLKILFPPPPAPAKSSLTSISNTCDTS